MDSPSNNIYKAIFTFQDFSSALDSPEVNMQITFGETIKTVPLPFKEALLIEALELNQNSKVQFQLEEPDGELIGYSELKIPNSVFTSVESEVNQQLLFQLVKGNISSIITNICVIFLTKKSPKDRKTEISKVKTQPAQVIGTINLSPKKSKKTTPQRHRMSELSPGLKKSATIDLSPNLQPSRSDRNLASGFLEDTTIHSNFELDSPTSVKGQSDLLSFKTETPNRPSILKLSTSPGTKSRASPSPSPSQSPSRTPVNARKSAISVTSSPFESPPKQKAHRFSLVDTVKKLTSETEIEKKSIPDLFFQEPIPEFTEERQLPEVFSTLENQLGDKGYLRAHVDFLKNTMITMDFKINEMNMVKSENNNLAQEAQRAIEARTTVEEQLNGTVSHLRDENEQLKAQIADLIARNEALNANNKEIQEESFKAKAETLKFIATCNQKENELMEAQLKNHDITETKNQLKRAHESLARVEIQRAQDQKNFMDALSRLRLELEETRLLLDKSSQEKKELIIQLTQERLSHQDTRNEVIVIQRRLENAEAYKEAITSLEVQRDELIRQLNELRAEKEEAFRMLEKAQITLTIKLREFENNENTYKTRIHDLEGKIRDQENEYSNLLKQLNVFGMNVSELNLRNGELELAVSRGNDLERHLSILQEQLERATKDKNVATQGVEDIVRNHEVMMNKLLDMERANDELYHVVAIKDQEIRSLKDSVAGLIEQLNMPDTTPKYVPYKDDYVDNMLADYLNNHKEASKYRLMFIRESEGVYQFGTKKIYIKVEGDHILIRVGGGYMTLQELLGHIAPMEYEKLMKYTRQSTGDEASRMIAKNIVLNKVLSGKLVTLSDKSKTQAYAVTKNTNVQGEASPNLQKIDMKSVSSPRFNKQQTKGF